MTVFSTIYLTDYGYTWWQLLFNFWQLLARHRHAAGPGGIEETVL